MNNKGQTVSSIVLVFIAVLVGVIIFQVVAQTVGTSTNTVAVVNTTLATVVNGTPQYLTNYRALSDVVVYNATGGVVTSGNYTVTNNVVYNGALSVQITPDTTAAYKYAWKVSGTAQPLTYIDDGGARSVAGLIVIFIALVIGLIALTPVFESKFGEMFG